MFGRFLKCGMVGWCFEIVWTSFDSFRRRQMQLKGNTSIWMFPIYGMAAFFRPIGKFIKTKKTWQRGIIYMVCIFALEYISGSILKKYNCCPWDYSKAKFNINGVIRLDYGPLWFLIGLYFENIMKASGRKRVE